MVFVWHVIYKDSDFLPTLPIAVIVEFEGYTGPGFDPRFPNCVSIVPVVSEMIQGSATLEMIQIPLKLSWAISIHKSQGLTLDKAIVDIGKTEKVCGLAYVALSRLKKLENVLIKPFSFDRLKAVKQSKLFEIRLTEQERLENLQMKTNTLYSYLLDS